MLRKTYAYKFFRSVYWFAKEVYWKGIISISKSGLRTFKLPDNLLIYYPLKSEVGKQLLLGNFEIPEVSFLKTIVKKGDIFLDIGANAGIYTIMASSWVGSSGHIYSFEIGPDEIILFKKNVAANYLTNVTLLPYAVSDKKGVAKFALSKDGAMNSLAENNHPHQKIKEWIEVETTTLSEAAKEFMIERVDVIKMDVEGAEKLVFEGGMSQLLNWKPRAIVFECSPLTATAFGYSVYDLIRYLQNNGLVIYSFGKKGALVPVNIDSLHRVEGYNFVATFSHSVFI